MEKLEQDHCFLKISLYVCVCSGLKMHRVSWCVVVQENGGRRRGPGEPSTVEGSHTPVPAEPPWSREVAENSVQPHSSLSLWPQVGAAIPVDILHYSLDDVIVGGATLTSAVLRVPHR